MPPARVTERARLRPTFWLAAVVSTLLLAMLGTSACIIIHTPAVPDDATPTPGWSENKYQAEKMLEALVTEAEKLVAEGVNALRAPERTILLITHYQRLLDYIVPDRVHVLSAGRIIKEGGKELALELEAKGYEQIVKDAA